MIKQIGNLPGLHGSTLHSCESMSVPTQSLPPLENFGFSQLRNLYFTPPPQLSEHGLHPFQ